MEINTILTKQCKNRKTVPQIVALYITKITNQYFSIPYFNDLLSFLTKIRMSAFYLNFHFVQRINTWYLTNPPFLNVSPLIKNYKF